MTASGIDPKFPAIKDVYFKNLLSELPKDESQKLNETFIEIFKTAHKNTYLTENASMETPRKIESLKDQFKTEEENFFDILDNE